jgi:hypothetical protein
MAKGKKVPDAWDDDWESQAEKMAREEQATGSNDKAEETAALTKAERLAKHTEQQRKLWEAAYVG